MEEKKEEKRKLPPTIRQGKDVKEGEPSIRCGSKVAALPPPIPEPR